MTVEILDTIDGLLAYQEGQRTCKDNPLIRERWAIRNVADKRLVEYARVLTLDKRVWRRAFQMGYFDQLNGVAGLLPKEGSEA